MGMCVYTCETLCSHIVTTLVLQTAPDLFTFVHCHFILYASVTLDSDSTSDSGYIYSGYNI